MQMTGGGASVVLGPSDPDTWHPDLDWLERELKGPRPPKLVYVVSPGNPTGALLIMSSGGDMCQHREGLPMATSKIWT